MGQMGKIVGSIQARYSATRLPGKMLKEIMGKPLLELMIERVKQAKYIDEIVLFHVNVEGSSETRYAELLKETMKSKMHVVNFDNEKLKVIEEARFMLQKENVVNNPEQFADLLGREFDNISRDFSKSMMDLVTLVADSMTRVLDTATDALVEAISSGEHVGKAIGDAIVQVATNITNEITKDVLKDLTRKMLANITGDPNAGETAAEKQAREAREADAQKQQDQLDTQNQIEINTRKSENGSVKKYQDDLFNLNPDKDQSQQLIDQLDGFKDEEIKEWQEGNGFTIDAITDSSDVSVENTNTLLGELRNGFNNMTTSLMNLGSSQDSSGGGIIDSIIGLGSSLIGSAGSTLMGGSAFSGGFGATGQIGTAMGGLGTTPLSQQSLMLAEQLRFAEGGITNALTRYATGGVTSGPELALVGDNSGGKEAIVPLPSGESIPVEFTGDEKDGDVIINTTINIAGVDTNNSDAVRRSAGQIAQAAGNATNRAVRRNG